MKVSFCYEDLNLSYFLKTPTWQHKERSLHKDIFLPFEITQTFDLPSTLQ